MKDRMKWIAVGFGFIVGIHVLTTLLFLLLFQDTQQSNVAFNQFAMLLFGVTLGSFFLGGFVIGRVGEEGRLLDAATAALAALAFSAIVYVTLPEGTRDLYTGSKWLTQSVGVTAPSWLSFAQMLPALGAAVLGSYLGYQMTTPLESAIERTFAVIGIGSSFIGIAAIYVIGSIVLPWWGVAALLIALIGGPLLCYWYFKRDEHKFEDNAIVVEHRREQHAK